MCNSGRRKCAIQIGVDNRRRPDAANAGEPTVRLLRCQAPRLCDSRSGDSWFGAHTTPPFLLMRRRSSCAMRLAFAPMVSIAVSIDPDILRYGGELIRADRASVNELATRCRSPTPRGSPDKREVSQSNSTQLLWREVVKTSAGLRRSSKRLTRPQQCQKQRQNGSLLTRADHRDHCVSR